MKTFKEFYEEETINEGFANVIGKVLGLGTFGVVTAWITALLIKGGIGAINSIADSFGKKGIELKKFVKENKNSGAVKMQLNKMEEEKNKHKEEISGIIKAINEKNWDIASGEFLSLPVDKKNSTEIKRIIVAEIIKVTNQLPISEPTPGNECYRAIKKIVGLAVAKSLSKAVLEQATKAVQEQGVR